MKQKTDPLHSFDRLPPEIETELRNQLHVHTFVGGESIFIQGAPAEAIYLVASGRVKVTRVTPEGYESVLCVRGPGDYFCPVPILDKGSHLGTAAAMTPVTLFRIEQSKFCDLCQASPELLAVVQGDCLNEVRHLLNRLEAFACRSVRERLIITLLDESRHQQSRKGLPVELRLTQQELAGLVGASRESISRILKQLEREGVVILRRGRVILHEMKRLKQLAQEK